MAYRGYWLCDLCSAEEIDRGAGLPVGWVNDELGGPDGQLRCSSCEHQHQRELERETAARAAKKETT